MPYSQFDPTKPVDTDLGTVLPDTARVNDCALRDAVIMGAMHGFLFSCSGGSAREPGTMLWTNGVIIVKGVLTWGSVGGATHNISAIAWSLSVDTGSTYNAIDSQTFTYDANGNLTATAASGGMSSWLISLIGRMSLAEGNITTLLADIAALGTMSTQNANNVGITGGYAKLLYQWANTVGLGNLNASHAIDWTAQTFITVTVTGSSATFTYSNLPPGGNGGMSGILVFKVVNGGLATSLFGPAKKPAGFGLSSGATDWVTLACVDGTTPEIIGYAKNVA